MEPETTETTPVAEETREQRRARLVRVRMRRYYQRHRDEISERRKRRYAYLTHGVVIPTVSGVNSSEGL